MKRAIIILVLCLPLFAATAQNTKNEASTIYVKPGATGDGSSWENPQNLQSALQTANFGQEIWVAAGTYLPTDSDDRNISFILSDGVAVFGGFSGTEFSKEQRDWLNNPTVLSGEIGVEGYQDNSYTIVYTEDVSRKTILDGFTITGANGNKKVSEGSPASSGAWFNLSHTKTSDPIIRNCTFENNRAYYGAAMYNCAADGGSSAVIDACKFIKNIAKFDGGAIVNNGTNGRCNISILYSKFYKNEAYYGASILNKAEATGEASPYIKNVQFTENLAYMNGSPIYNLRTGEGACTPIMVACVSERNKESVEAPESTQIRSSPAKQKPKRTITISPTRN
ncbi:MAG: hypothetical protein AAF242_09470 [Bacteroidota bacterium]